MLVYDILAQCVSFSHQMKSATVINIDVTKLTTENIGATSNRLKNHLDIYDSMTTYFDTLIDPNYRPIVVSSPHYSDAG